jgi:hypothetical protein
MEYTDYNLKAPNQFVYEALVPESGWTGVTLDPIGTIYRETGETTTNENGWPVPVVEATDGYHINVRVEQGVELPDALKPFLIEIPKHPKRVFA